MYYDNNVTQYYKPELDFIKFDSIREATELMLSRAPKFYMDVDAASNPKYSKDRDGNILKLKEHTKAVEVAICILSELAKENKKDIMCFDIDKIDAYLKKIEQEWMKKQEKEIQMSSNHNENNQKELSSSI